MRPGESPVKGPYDRLRDLYLEEEPVLLEAIRRGDRKEATRIVNLVLIHIYSASADQSGLLKGRRSPRYSGAVSSNLQRCQNVMMTSKSPDGCERQ